jgi:hypothetical protein
MGDSHANYDSYPPVDSRPVTALNAAGVVAK